MRNIIGLILFLAFFSFTFAAEGPADPRRTPAVEVFQHNKDAVIFLTGPKLGERAEETAEFFVTSKVPVLFNQSSGFVVHDSGYILSNAHAVQKMIQYEVILSDGKKYPAELLAVGDKPHHRDPLGRQRGGICRLDPGRGRGRPNTQ